MIEVMATVDYLWLSAVHRRSCQAGSGDLSQERWEMATVAPPPPARMPCAPSSPTLGLLFPPSLLFLRPPDQPVCMLW